MENTYYTPMSAQRAQLRKEWNAQIKTGVKDWEEYLNNAELFYKIKTEILQICEAFKLGSYIGMTTKGEAVAGFQLTEFRTSKGVFTHYYKIK